jgi:hypothetical protein
VPSFGIWALIEQSRQLSFAQFLWRFSQSPPAPLSGASHFHTAGCGAV